MGKLQWHRADAQEGRGPAGGASRDAPGEARTSPQEPLLRATGLQARAVRGPCSSHRALPVSAEGLGAAKP